MTLSTKLHDAITDYNVLTKPTDQLVEYFAYHPTAFKIALLVNHIFRAAAMVGFMIALPVSTPVSIGICLAGSLFYRLTVESNCAYKFALPAVGGSIAFLIGKSALENLANSTFATCIPLALYGAYVVLTVNYDVDNRPCPFCVSDS